MADQSYGHLVDIIGIAGGTRATSRGWMSESQWEVNQCLIVKLGRKTAGVAVRVSCSECREVRMSEEGMNFDGVEKATQDLHASTQQDGSWPVPHFGLTAGSP
jgi:hypothetical protein